MVTSKSAEVGDRILKVTFCFYTMPKKLLQEEVIRRFREVHGDFYDYSKVVYVNSETKVCVICPVHGEFWITPSHHMNGVGCAKCHFSKVANLRRMTKEEFVERATIKHNGFYKYDKVEYINSTTKVCITCPDHGDYWQEPSNHLQGSGCWYCGNKRNSERLKGKAVYVTRKTKYGIGVVDTEVSNTGDKAYLTWINMLRRCYDEGLRHKFPTYKDCVVCDEWLRLSEFKKWFDNNYVEGYSLDKDILVRGNKVYSPETCCFVPQQINAMLTKGDAIRGNLPIGVSASGRRFVARISINKKLKIIGYYDDPISAFNAYKPIKENHIKEVATEYYNKGLIKENVYNALMDYTIEITD